MCKNNITVTALQDPVRHVYTNVEATLIERSKIYIESPVLNETVLKQGSGYG